MKCWLGRLARVGKVRLIWSKWLVVEPNSGPVTILWLARLCPACREAAKWVLGGACGKCWMLMNGACARRSSVVGSEPCASAHDHDIHAAWHKWCPRCHIRFHTNKRVDMVWIWKSRATHHQVPPCWVRVQKRMRKCWCVFPEHLHLAMCPA